MNDDNVAVFGGGCFWCTEAVYQRLAGVTQVIPGYAGGHTKNPTYEKVTSGATGHAEVVKVEFDPAIITYQTLLEVFFETHDPTTPNRQGNDIGTQYRSIILTTTKDQHNLANAYIELMEKSGIYQKPIITQIKPLERFYAAENYHQDYFNNNQSQPYCQLVINPKLNKLLKNFPHLTMPLAEEP